MESPCLLENVIKVHLYIEFLCLLEDVIPLHSSTVSPLHWRTATESEFVGARYPCPFIQGLSSLLDCPFIHGVSVFAGVYYLGPLIHRVSLFAGECCQNAFMYGVSAFARGCNPTTFIHGVFTSLEDVH